MTYYHCQMHPKIKPDWAGSNLAESNVNWPIRRRDCRSLSFFLHPFPLMGWMETWLAGSALGWMVNKLARAPLHLRGLVVGCCAAGDENNICLHICQCSSPITRLWKVETHLYLHMQDGCNEKKISYYRIDRAGGHETHGMQIIILYLSSKGSQNRPTEVVFSRRPTNLILDDYKIGVIYMWSYVYNIVRISSKGSSKEVEEIDCSVSKSSIESSTSQTGSCTEPLLSSKVSEDHADLPALPCTRFDEKTQSSATGKIKQQLVVLLRKVDLKRLLAPSTTAAIVGFVVGLVPLIRKSMIGDEAPLLVIQGSATLLGDGAIPAITLIIGGNLLRGLRGSGINISIIVGIIISRYVVLPLTGILIVKGALWLSWVSPDPLYQFVLLLQFALPPAMNIGIMTQLFGTGESECSVIMLWSYALASISLTLWSTFFLWLVAGGLRLIITLNMHCIWSSSKRRRII